MVNGHHAQERLEIRRAHTPSRRIPLTLNDDLLTLTVPADNINSEITGSADYLYI